MVATELKAETRETTTRTAPLDDSGSWLGAVVLIVLSVLVAFYPVVIEGKTTTVAASHCNSIMPGGAYGGDHANPASWQISRDPWSASCQTEAIPMFIGSMLRKEQRLPLWNVYSGCGMPFLANIQNQIFSPFNWIMVLFPSDLAVDIFTLLRLVCAGIFSFFALRMLMPGSLAPLTGAVGYMLTGYFLLNLNVLDLNVHLTIPALLLAQETVIRWPGVRSVVFCTAIVALNLLGGHPECCFLALSFSGWYHLARLLTLDGWRQRIRIFGLIAIAYLAGLTIALPVILPFLEYVRISDNCHDPSVIGSFCGLDYDRDWKRGLLSYVFPVGWVQKYFANGFYGAALSFLALVGACAACKTINAQRQERVVRALMLFFGAAFAFMLLKRFGSPFVNWVGMLPLFNMVLFCRYDEPLMAMCIAALAAFGVRSVQLRSAKPWPLASLAVMFWLVVSALNFLTLKSATVPNVDSPAAMKFNMMLGLGTLCATAILCLLSYKSAIVRRALPAVLLIPFLIETCSGFMSQMFYGKEGLASRNFDPYRGAPYIDFLKSKADSNARVIGFDGLLLPNWSAAFSTQDIRYIDSLCPSRYAELINAFLPNPAASYRGRGFYGSEKTTYDAASVRRLCSLTSTRYVLSMLPIGEYYDLILNGNRRFAPSPGQDGLCFVPSAKIDGYLQRIMFQHPQADAAKNEYQVSVVVPDVNPVLAVDFVRNPDVACPARSAPVKAIVSIKSSDSSVLPEQFVFENRDSSKLHATRYSIDLYKFAGKRVTVSLTSKPTDQEECPWEWVGWKKMSFIEVDNVKCIYDREIKIHELPEAIPHAAVFTAADVVDDDAKVLSELQRQSFSPLTRVVFSRSDLPRNTVTSLSKVNSDEPCRPARILKYESDLVEIQLPEITRPALLLLTDNCFPGWLATIDGKEQIILRGNHCFRALLLQPGARTVRFVYDSWTFKVGAAASLLTIGALFLLAVRSRIWRSANR